MAEPLPFSNEVANIVVGQLSCDDAPGLVLKVLVAIEQSKLFYKQLEKKLAATFQNDIGDDFQSLGREFQDALGAQLTDVLEEASDFEQWTSQFSRDALSGNVLSPTTPSERAQASNPDNFSLFGVGVTTGQIGVGNAGSAEQLVGSDCEISVQQSLVKAALTDTLRYPARAAAQIADSVQLGGIAAKFANQPENLLNAAFGALDGVLAAFTTNTTILDAMSTAADAVLAELKKLVPSDYAIKLDLASGAVLVEQALTQAGRAEQAVAAGNNGRSEADALRAAVERARFWLCGNGRLGDVQLIQATVVGMVLMLQEQLRLVVQCVTVNGTTLRNFTGIDSNLQQLPGPQGLFNNFFTAFRCQLDRLLAELTRFNQQSTQAFLSQRVVWCATLAAQKAALDLYRPAVYQAKLSAALTSPAGQALTTAAASITDELQIWTDAVAPLQVLINAFDRAARARLVRDTPIAALEDQVNAIKAQLTVIKNAQQGMADKLTALLAGNATQTAAGKTLLRVLNTGVFAARIAQSLLQVDYAATFSVDAAQQSLSLLYAQLLAKAQSCCEESGATDPQSRAAIFELQQRQAAGELDLQLEQLDVKFFDHVGSDARFEIQAGMQRIKRQIRELQQILRAPCLGLSATSFPTIV